MKRAEREVQKVEYAFKLMHQSRILKDLDEIINESESPSMDFDSLRGEKLPKVSKLRDMGNLEERILISELANRFSIDQAWHPIL